MNQVYKKKVKGSENLFRDSFRELSLLMGAKHKFEKSANLSNFDSGIPLEDYFREEFSKFIPKKYSVDSATIIDQDSYSCGDCDFIIYDDKKSVFIKSPSTKNSRRKFLFHESTYGIIEVKQKLTLGNLRTKKTKTTTHFKDGTLHQALKKLFSYKQLNREEHINDSVISVRPGTEGKEGVNLTNTSFAYAFFYDTDVDINDDTQRENLIREFYWLNMNQPINERINGVFVLNQFFISWKQPDNGAPAYWPPKIENPSVYMGIPGKDTLYFLYVLLANVLRVSEVTVPIFNRDYGGSKYLKAVFTEPYSGK